MKLSITLTVVLALGILSLPGTALAQEAGAGMIEGQLTNGTAGGSNVADQEVTLKTYRNEAELPPATAKTNPEGYFVFKGLSTSAEYSYEVTLTYQQAEYSSDRLSFGAGETSKYSEIIVYDATTSDEALKVMTAYTVISTEPGSLRVMEYLLVVNNSDRTYIGARELSPGVRETLAFMVPAKATELNVGADLMSCCIYRNQTGFVDSMPVLPGGRELVYSYRVDYEGADYTFSWKVNYSTMNYDLLIQSPNVQIVGNQLVQYEPLLIQERQFSNFSGQNLAAGDVVVAQISGLPRPASLGSLMWVLLALVLLGAGFTFFYIRRRRRQQPVRVSTARQRERLLTEIARLDDDFEGGRISQETYRRLREQKKARLVEMMQRAKGEQYKSLRL